MSAGRDILLLNIYIYIIYIHIYSRARTVPGRFFISCCGEGGEIIYNRTRSIASRRLAVRVGEECDDDNNVTIV
jgi:hypothetical protein